VDLGQTVMQPVQEIAAGSGFTQVSAGCASNVALRSDGTAWTWGFNDAGELGDGTFTNSSAPVQVTGLTNVTQVSAGCSFALAVHTVPLQFHL
jgi:alpha-tubulin suppressor-like RCC1 family protein